MFYDIVFFLSPEAVAAGAKVSLVNGQYVITKAAATTIQAINGGRPPVDQSSEVAALTNQVTALQGQVVTLQADLGTCQAALADCLDGEPPPPVNPTITGFAATPGTIDAGQPTVLDATVANAVSTTLDGAPATLPVTVTPAASKTYTLVATGASGTTPAMALAGVVVNAVLPPIGTMVPVLPNDFGHEHQRWMADFADASKLVPRADPWRLPAIVQPMGGAKPARLRVWHTFGQRLDLYSQLPHFDSNGQSAPWSPQPPGDNFKAIVADLQARPLPDGPRGKGIISPYITAIDHPHEITLPDGTKVPIPNAPTWLGGRHDAVVQFYYSDGRIFTAGKIPNITHMHDWCVDEIDRKLMLACSFDSFDSAGKVTSASVKLIDRAAGMVGPGQPSEDPSKYVVADYMTGLVYVTGCATDAGEGVTNPTFGNRYVVDFGAGGKIYKNAALWKTIPNAFAIRYDNGKVYVLTSTISVFAIDCVSGAVGPDLFAQNLGTFLPGARFVGISIDRNGTFDEVGNITVYHSAGGTPYAMVRDSTGVVKTFQAKYGVGNGYKRVGNIMPYGHEWFAHYIWMIQYHRWQARLFCGGLASHPHEVVAYKTAGEVPAEETTDASLNGYVIANLAQQVMRKGGSLSSPFDKPSLTCWVSRDGASPFLGCSYDEMAEKAFDVTEAFIRGGMIGQFRRDDLTSAEMYAVLVDIYQNSMRYLIDGGALMVALKAWWIGKYGAVPAIPTATAYTPEPALRLVPRFVSGLWKVVVMNSNGYDTTTAPPAGAIIVADEGMSNQVTLPATLSPGQHALTAKAAGWASQAVVMKV